VSLEQRNLGHLQTASELSDEGGDITPVLCLDALVHRARLLAIQRAILAGVAFGHETQSASTLQLQS
jgi:hypothetical protein